MRIGTLGMAYLFSHRARASAGVVQRIGDGWGGATTLVPCFWHMAKIPLASMWKSAGAPMSKMASSLL